MPEEERLAAVLVLLHELDRVLDQHIVEGGHVVFGIADTFAFSAVGGTSGIGSRRERSLVDDLLLADGAPARLDGCIVGIACPAMDEVPRSDRVTDRRVRRV